MMIKFFIFFFRISLGKPQKLHRAKESLKSSGEGWKSETREI